MLWLKRLIKSYLLIFIDYIETATCQQEVPISDDDEPMEANDSSSSDEGAVPEPQKKHSVLSNGDSRINLPPEPNEAENIVINKHLSCDDDDESEDSRFIPDIDDYSVDTDDADSQISLKMVEEVKLTAEVAPEVTTQETLSSEHLSAAARFSDLCKQKGMEILKLNRRNKWQVRYLTVSSETFQLHHSSNLSNYPRALLWTKRFNGKHVYSRNGINSEGKGGVEFNDIENIDLETSENIILPKSFPKFQNSVQLNLQYHCGENLRSVAMRFKTPEEANLFSSSIDSILAVLDFEGSF